MHKEKRNNTIQLIMTTHFACTNDMDRDMKTAYTFVAESDSTKVKDYTVWEKDDIPKKKHADACAQNCDGVCEATSSGFKCSADNKEYSKYSCVPIKITPTVWKKSLPNSSDVDYILDEVEGAIRFMGPWKGTSLPSSSDYDYTVEAQSWNDNDWATFADGMNTLS